LGIPLTTGWRMKTRDMIMKRIRSVLKPTLTPTNQLTRFLFALDHLSANQNFYRDFYDEIHVDEKWFYLTRDRKGYYVAVDEEPPKRQVKNKQSITKVMFLCAVARPHHDSHTNSFFDGKIGIWPIGEFRPAERASKNRPKGTMVWHNIPVTREVYLELLQNKVLPAIMDNFPGAANGRRIILQQDGAKSHIDENDISFADMAEQLGLNITLVKQPANSPDLNINDLFFFEQYRL
jgi:hypothetical protein